MENLNQQQQQQQQPIQVPSFVHEENSRFDIQNRRQQQPFSDELVIRKAMIYDVLGPTDDRLQVKVLPEFLGITDEEKKYLPKWPPFFKGKVITGLSEKVDGEGKAEYVWCICTPDLQVGYILGKNNIFGDYTISYEPESYDYNFIKTWLEQRDALLSVSDFSYNRLKIRDWFQSDDGGYIEILNEKTGDLYIVNTAGTYLTIQQKRIYMRVGAPPDPLSSGPVAFSSIDIDAGRIYFVTPQFEVKSDKIILGYRGLTQIGNLTGDPMIDKNGESITPAENIVF